MKKIIFTLAALAVISTGSFAGQRTDVDPRDRLTGDINAAGSSFNSAAGIKSNAASSLALAVAGGSGETAFERMTRLHNEYEFGGH